MTQTQKLDTAVTPQGLKNRDGNEMPAIEPTAAGIEIADYELLEKLGSGGYGEVWKAIGPGGLPKAVKILFGEKTGQHAAVELKALQRMRELRHPFLLSIERIEVIDNRLIVVTELADRNLSDEFDACRRNGQQGIERDVLVRHLSDVADALDYMYEQHGLQHLDIKPDNILLQGDRAKVGDFGLAKDISRSEVSMLNGFTPMYAAPELFEGNPGAGSDQYSLAMMYTMMLTGKLPFTGRTPAQLMSQHMKSPPDLSPLQPVDRPVIARALSKNPNARFDSNRAFIEELSRRKASRGTRGVRFESPTTKDPKTAVVEGAQGDNVARPDQQPSQPRSHTPAAVTQTSRLRASAFVGIGGLGGMALQELKRQFISAGPEGSETPFPLLLIDSDRDALNQARASGLRSGLKPEETVHVPLKKSKEYKANSNLDLSWLSRRWLFNIPRSGSVDGIRPLGRLVLADHQAEIRRRLKEVLQEAVDENNISKASEQTEIPVSSQGLDVYVVASSTGGTSSGMVADIGLLVQHVARHHGIQDIQVHCVLLHGTGLVRTTADVQDANTLSLLKELRHLSTPGLGSPRGFKGDNHSPDDCPFASCRMVSLGEGASETVMAQRAEQVGRFLFDVSTTAAQLDFQHWKLQQEHSSLGPVSLQVLGLDQQNAAHLESASAHASQLTASLLGHWITKARCQTEDGDAAGPLEEMRLQLTNLNLTETTLPNQIMSILQGETGTEVKDCSDDLLEQILEQAGNDSISQSQLLQSITEQGFRKQANPDERTIPGIVNEVSSILATARKHAGDLLKGQLLQLLDSPGRLKAMKIAGQLAVKELEQTALVCTNMREKIESAFASLTDGASDELILSRQEAVDQCRQYCTLLAWQLVYRCFIDHLQALNAYVQQLLDQLSKLKDSLVEHAAAIATQPELQSDFAASDSEDAAHEFDRFLRGGNETFLSGLFSNPESAISELNQLKQMAQQFIIAAAITDREDAASNGGRKQFPATAWPRIGQVGGIRRVLALLPESLNPADWSQKLEKEFGDCVGCRSGSNDHLAVYCEVDEVPWESVMNAISFNRAAVEEVASRVHTRIDVDW